MQLTIEAAKEMMKADKGNLILSGMEIQSLPEGLAVEDSLYLRGTRIQSLLQTMSSKREKCF